MITIRGLADASGFVTGLQVALGLAGRHPVLVHNLVVAVAALAGVAAEGVLALGLAVRAANSWLSAWIDTASATKPTDART